MKKILIVVGGIILAALIFLAIKFGQFYGFIYTPKASNQQKKPADKTSYSILLMGYGGGAHEGADLTDTMIVASIDTKTKKVHLVSLPRDLWIQLPTKSGADFHTKINAIHEIEMYPQTYPDVTVGKTSNQHDAALTKEIVGKLTGLTIDNYVGIDFAGFEKAIDLIGGVDINVAKTFDDYEYPIEGKEKDLCERDDAFKQIEPYLNGQGDQAARDQLFKDHPDLEQFFKDITEDPKSAFPCRYEHLHFDKGMTHMDGATALKYVRSRHSLQDGTDFGRAARQQLLIEAVRSKVLSVSFVPRIVPFLDEMKKYIKTDIGPEDLQKFIQFAPSSTKYTIKTFVPSTNDLLQITVSDDGQSILAPKAGIDNWSEFKKAIQNYIHDIIPTPTPGPVTPTEIILKITP